MSKYLDDRSFATLPGGITVSWDKVALLEPAVMGDGTYKCSPSCEVQHPVREQRERMVEHLEHGCCGAALVVSLEPLVVAAYSSDLDLVVLLRYPSSFVERYGLELGTRLLGVSLFVKNMTRGELYYAVDVIPGAGQTWRWSNYEPLIAEFVSDDLAAIEQRKREVDGWEWRRAAECADVRIRRLGLAARDGIPSRAGFPVRPKGGSDYFQPLAAFAPALPRAAARDASGGSGTAVADEDTTLGYIVLAVFGALLFALGWLIAR